MAFEPITTQEEFDKAIKERIDRATKSATSKFADYEDLKKKAQAYDEAQEANKSELQKAADKIAQLESEKQERAKADAKRQLKAKVAKDKGVPETLLAGDDEESMSAYADSLLEFAKNQTPSAPKDPSAGSFAKNKKDDSEERAFVRALFGRE